MRADVFDAEAQDVGEDAAISPVVIRGSLLNSCRNPFHPGAPREDCRPMKGDGERERCRLSTQTSSNVARPEPSFPVAAAEKQRKRVNYPAPKVAFPYITELNSDLEQHFDLILDSLPALPCEVKQRTLKLPPCPKTRTLVLGLEGTLVTGPPSAPPQDIGCLQGSKPRLRPHLREFLDALSQVFELIVTSMLNGCRSSQRVRRTTRPKCSRRSTRDSG